MILFPALSILELTQPEYCFFRLPLESLIRVLHLLTGLTDVLQTNVNFSYTIAWGCNSYLQYTPSAVKSIEKCC